MSMNLVFSVKGGAGYVDFPFQTPTELTRKVLGKDSVDSRLEVLSDAMNAWRWDAEIITDMMADIRRLMENPNLELTEI